MPIKKGDFILIDYTGSVKETGEVFDTTLEEVAKSKGVYKAEEIYEPTLIVVGEGWMLKALDESFPTFELGKAASVDIPPEKAFGNRDPEKVRMVSLRRLTARGITPRPGLRIEWDGKPATVRTTGSGRIQLDFNPPLAGKTLLYEVTVKKRLTTRAQKISALIHRRIPRVDVNKFSLETGQKEVAVSVPEEALYVEGLQLAKRGIAVDIQKFFPQLTIVKFIEVFKKPEPAEAKPEAPKETKKARKPEKEKTG